MHWHSPWALLLLVIIPVLLYVRARRRPSAAVKFPSLVDIRKCPISWRLRLRPLLTGARMAALALLIIALARPRQRTVLSEVSTEGVAMEVVVDRSGSMGTEMDYYGQKLNRLQVVKRVLAKFIAGDEKGFTGRSSDLVGLVTFARYADTTCPLVLSHGVLLEFMRNTDIVKLKSEDGTAIGDAIALAAARLEKAEQQIQQRKKKLGLAGEDVEDDQAGFKIKSKAVILLTDGRNNTGRYSPLEAAKLAKKWGIKIYTIGIGSTRAYTTIQTPLGTYKLPSHDDLDEVLLKAIADETGGFYGRADDAKSLQKVIEEIDKLEKTEVKSVQYAQYSEDFEPWALAALILLLSEMVAGCTVFRKIP